MALECFCGNLACRRRFLFPDATAGKSVRCASCGSTFVAGASATAASPSPASALPRPAPSLVGTTLGRYAVRERLGAGAFGVVYRAFDPVLDRDVALKLPNAAVLMDERRIERFLREAKAAAGLRHPHVVPVFDCGRDGEHYYIASAFIDGKPLADDLPPGGTDLVRAAGVVRELAEALAYAHGQGIVHRDVKPENVMVDASGHVHLMDFGLASRQDEERLTHDEAVLGTPAYMAPEHAVGLKGEPQPASDQYSAGVVLYSLLTGEPPFTGPVPIVLHNAVHTAPPPPRATRPDVPRDLETICLKAMAKRPGDRYPNCQALADDLRRWLEGEPILARRLSPRERLVRWVRKEPRLAAADTLIAALLILGMGLVYASGVRARESARVQQDLREKAEGETERARAAERTAEDAFAKLKAALTEVGIATGDVRELRGRLTEQQSKVEAARKQIPELQTQLLAAQTELQRSITAERDAQAKLARTDAMDYAWRIQAAYQHAISNRGEAALSLLDRATPELRGWEWRHVRDLCEGKRRVSRFPLAARSRAAIGTGGSHLGISWTDTMWSIYDAKTGTELNKFTNQVNKFRNTNDIGFILALDSSGDKAIITNGERSVRMWDAKEWKSLILLDGHAGPVLAAAFDGAGTRLVTASADRTVCVWDIESGKTLHKLIGHTAAVTGVGFSPDGTRVVTASDDRTVRVWELAEKKEVLKLTSPDGFRPSVMYNRDGTRVLTVSGSTIQLWDAVSGREGIQLTGASDVSAAAFSPDGTRIVTVSRDATRIWDSKNGGPVLLICPDPWPKTSVVWSPNGESIVTAGEREFSVFTAPAPP